MVLAPDSSEHHHDLHDALADPNPDDPVTPRNDVLMAAEAISPDDKFPECTARSDRMLAEPVESVRDGLGAEPVLDDVVVEKC